MAPVYIGLALDWARLIVIRSQLRGNGMTMQ